MDAISFEPFLTELLSPELVRSENLDFGIWAMAMLPCQLESWNPHLKGALRRRNQKMIIFTHEMILAYEKKINMELVWNETLNR